MTRGYDSPLVVEVTRGTEVESSHLVDAVGGGRRWACGRDRGDVGRTILPRSAIKPIQTLPLIDIGAADRFEMTDIELALACASHDGEPDHVAALERWLVRIGLTKEALECGSHAPQHGPSATELAHLGVEPGPRHNNCSGNHIGFLTVCQHLSEPFHVAGSDRACTRILRAAAGTTAVKTGAEGVFCGVVLDRGLGIALKARDGGRRASEAAIEWILQRLGVLISNGPAPVVNWAGTLVGEIRVST